MKNPHGTTTDFIRSLPLDLPATEVIAKAKKAGIKVSKAYVHNIRSSTRKAARAMSKAPAVKGTRAQKEKLLRALIMDLGPARVKKLVQYASASTAL